ncbi:MAG: hypothetical protein FWG82_04290 [Oscillospiraceae bacterium]|nr:hypothetical protein [Oscillospiraceae bacterium]
MHGDYFWHGSPCPEAGQVVLLRGCPDGKKNRLLELLAGCYNKNGEETQCFAAPLRPSQLVALYLPAREVIFLDSHFAGEMAGTYEFSLDEGRDWTALAENAGEIAMLDKKITACEEKYRRFFKTAALLQNRFNALDVKRLNKARLERCALRLAEKEFPQPTDAAGQEEIRALSAMSGKGMAARFLTIANLCDRLILMEDFSGGAGDYLLKALRRHALERGLNITACYSPLGTQGGDLPSKQTCQPNTELDFLFIPALKLGAGVCNRFHNPEALIAALDGNKRFTHMRILRSERFYFKLSHTEKRRMRFLHRAQWELLDEASRALALREEYLERLEGLYGQWDGLDDLWEVQERCEDLG